MQWLSQSDAWATLHFQRVEDRGWRLFVTPGRLFGAKVIAEFAKRRDEFHEAMGISWPVTFNVCASPLHIICPFCVSESTRGPESCVRTMNKPNNITRYEAHLETHVNEWQKGLDRLPPSDTQLTARKRESLEQKIEMVRCFWDLMGTKGKAREGSDRATSQAHSFPVVEAGDFDANILQVTLDDRAS